MTRSLTMGARAPRLLSLLAGLVLATIAALTVAHFFEARFPSSMAEIGSCDADAFFNCVDSANAPVSAPGGIPLGFFGFVVGVLAVLGALFPSPEFERTNRTIALGNVLLATALSLYSVFGLRSLCPLCTSYTLFSIVHYLLFWQFGLGAEHGWKGWLRPSAKHAAVAAAAVLLGGWGMETYHEARLQARQEDVTAGFVADFFALEPVREPSTISPFRVMQATARWEDAPIRVVEFSDFRCSDCLYLSRQMEAIEREFAGRINWAYQFFPLEAACNDVVEKDKHPGACELAYIAAAAGPERFREVHDRIFEAYDESKSPEWRAGFAQRNGIDLAARDTAVNGLVQRIIRTGAEYERTSEKYSHGIRSTPTLLINGRMVIGTLPYEQLRAILRAVLKEESGQGRRFMENWVEET